MRSGFEIGWTHEGTAGSLFCRLLDRLASLDLLIPANEQLLLDPMPYPVLSDRTHSYHHGTPGAKDMKPPPIMHFQIVGTQNASIPWLWEDPIRYNEGSNIIHADGLKYFSAWIRQSPLPRRAHNG